MLLPREVLEIVTAARNVPARCDELRVILTLSNAEELTFERGIDHPRIKRPGECPFQTFRPEFEYDVFAIRCETKVGEPDSVELASRPAEEDPRPKRLVDLERVEIALRDISGIEDPGSDPETSASTR